MIIRYYPEKNNYLLNEVLLNIIACEEDLKMHCMVEDNLFIPAVKKMEQDLAIYAISNKLVTLDEIK